MCWLREVLIYHNGYRIPKLWAYVNHGIFLSNTKSSLHRQANYGEKNQLSLFSLKLTICLLQEVLIYHNGYHIPKLWAYVNHGIFLAKLNQVTA